MTNHIKKIFIDTIAEYHQLANLSEPVHPFLSVVKFEDLNWKPERGSVNIIRNFYTIALKKNINTNFEYGQQAMDFNGGVMHLMSPRQVLTIQSPPDKITNSGWQLLIHPGFLSNTGLAKSISRYEYFNYRCNQALPLSAEEEEIIINILQTIYSEICNHENNNHHIISAHIELLLAYIERFYRREQDGIIKNEVKLLARLEILIEESLSNEYLATLGIPTVEHLSGKLHISANHLSRMLKKITGQTTKHYIQDKIIELSKEKLSTRELSISEIAFVLGFSSPQSFSRLFKHKTNMTPSKFRDT